jgi:hypothetical protein
MSKSKICKKPEKAVGKLTEISLNSGITLEIALSTVTTTRTSNITFFVAF